MAASARGTIVCFDNSGTLSSNVSRGTLHDPEATWALSVPNAPVQRGRLALCSLDHGSIRCLDRDGSLGKALTDADANLHLTLANCDVDSDVAATAVRRERDLPARAALDDVRAARRAATDEFEEAKGPEQDALPTGVQFVVDVDADRVLRTIGYCCIPVAVARNVVAWAGRRGFASHIVSGDTRPILSAVGNVVGIGSNRIHAYQSPADKRETVETLQADGRLVVMVGDYVNDRDAFEAADFAVFIDDGDESVRAVLEPVADVVVDDLADVPEAFEKAAPF